MNHTTMSTDSRVCQSVVSVSHVCHVYGHNQSDQVNHLLNVARRDCHDVDNLVPAPGSPCPTCGRDCHAETEAARGST